MTKTPTRTQYRANCPICFKDHAVRSLTKPTMVEHGYQRPQGWHQNVNQCTGTHAMHFGTPEGRIVAANNAAFVRRWAQGQRDSAQAYRTNPPATIKVDDQYIRGVNGQRGHYTQIDIDATDDRYESVIKGRINGLEIQAKHADQSAAEIEKLVADWKPVEPTPVEVETGPTIHAVNEYLSKRRGRDMALCAGYQSEGYKVTSRDRATITCKACLKSLAATDADKVVSEKADALIAEMVAKYGEGVKVTYSDAADKAVKEIRYQRKEIDKNVRKRATDRIERGVK